MRVTSPRYAFVIAVLSLSLTACRSEPREGTYDQVFAPGSAMAQSGYKATLVIEPNNRFRYQIPMTSIAGDIRRSSDSLYFETGSPEMRMVALRGRMVRDTLVLEQPQMRMLGGLVGPDVAVQRFVRRSD
jgi:hypothetical protein